MWPTTSLVDKPLFQPLRASASIEERVRRSYARARAIVQAYGMSSRVRVFLCLNSFLDLTVEDIATTSERFWGVHTDPILTMDGSAGTLVTIQLNLFTGTLAKYARSRPDLHPILQDALQFKIRCEVNGFSGRTSR